MQSREQMWVHSTCWEGDPERGPDYRKTLTPIELERADYDFREEVFVKIARGAPCNSVRHGSCLGGRRGEAAFQVVQKTAYFDLRDGAERV